LDCGGFGSQEEAQEMYEISIEGYGNDIYDLDRDNDGVACEGLK